MLAVFSFWGLLWGLLCLIFCASRLSLAPRQLGWAALACGVHACLLLVPPWPFFAFLLGLHPLDGWQKQVNDPVNWLSKSVCLLASLAWVYGLHRVTPAAAGLRRPQFSSLRVVGAVVVAVASWLLVDAYLMRHNFASQTWPQLLFYSTMPGLEEEVFYRGVLLGLLSPVFARTLPFLGTSTSWGGVVGVLLFMLGHNLGFPARLFGLGLGADFWRYVGAWLSPLQFPPSEVLYQLGMGTLFLWVRERTGSCWAAAATHCLMNGCLALGHALA